jgi:hypothetical protein
MLGAPLSFPARHTHSQFASTLFVSSPLPMWSRVTSCVVTQRAVTSSLARVLIPYLPHISPSVPPSQHSPASWLLPYKWYSHGSIYPNAQRKRKRKTFPQPQTSQTNAIRIQNTETLYLVHTRTLSRLFIPLITPVS